MEEQDRPWPALAGVDTTAINNRSRRITIPGERVATPPYGVGKSQVFQLFERRQVVIAKRKSKVGFRWIATSFGQDLVFGCLDLPPPLIWPQSEIRLWNTR